MIAVGIDVSKSKSTVAILNADGTQLVRPFNMAHTLPEMNSFVERLRTLEGPVTILMEYTGHYHYPVLKKLQAEGFPVCLINPYQMKKYGDVEIHKAKTDRKDVQFQDIGNGKYQDIGKYLCQHIGKSTRYNRHEGGAGDAVEGDQCDEREALIHRSDAETRQAILPAVPGVRHQRKDGTQVEEPILRTGF